MKSTDKAWELFAQGKTAKEVLNSRELSILNSQEFSKLPVSRSMEILHEIEERGELFHEFHMLEKGKKPFTLRTIHERKLRLVFQ